MPKDLNPLTDRHRETLNRMRELIGDLGPYLERLESCGVGCDDKRQQVTMMAEFVDAIEGEFLQPLIDA